MLSAGLSTIGYLKSRILPAAQAVETTWDAALSALGLAITRRMEAAVNRKLDRDAAAVDEYSAWTLGVTLRRYPVESITSVQVRAADGALAAVTDYTLDKAAGLLEFTAAPGTRAERLVITYAGGYWLDPRTLPATALPEGATALPEDLLDIWAAEVQAHAEMRGTFEALGLRAPTDRAKVRLVEGLTESTVEGLRGYRRFGGE